MTFNLNRFNHLHWEFIFLYTAPWGFPGGSVVKNLPANAGDMGVIRSGRSSGGGNGNPLQYSSWRNPWTEEPGVIQSLG